MGTQLSENWKKLQASLQTSTTITSTKKRKATDSEPKQVPRKKIKVPDIKTTTTIKTNKPKKRPNMGAVTSQPTRPNADSTHQPTSSLALIHPPTDSSLLTPETISEALALANNSSSPSSLTTTTTTTTTVDPSQLGKYLAIDCEMVATTSNPSTLARVSLVDFHLRPVYDSYVHPGPHTRVTDYRTPISGITPAHLRAAPPFAAVHAAVARLVAGRVLVGHDLRHDLAALQLEHHPRRDVRDTARFAGFKKYGNGPKPALRVLARELLGLEIQQGQHSSVEDARVTMLLFRKHKPAFDVEHANRYPQTIPRSVEAAAAKPKAKPAKKKTTKKKRRN